MSDITRIPTLTGEITSMNEHFQVLKGLLNSTEQLLDGEHGGLESLEIQDSARDLHKSLQPCLQELKIYVTKFQPFIKSCLDDLDHAKDVWNSKYKIKNFSTTTIWEIVGDLASLHSSFQDLCQKELKVTLDGIKCLVEEIINLVKNKYFFDKNNQKFKIDLGWGDKDNFNKNISQDIHLNIKEIEKIIEFSLKKLSMKLLSINTSIIADHVNLLDNKSLTTIDQNSKREIRKIGDLFDKINCFKINEKGAYFIKNDIFSVPSKYVQKWKTQGGYIEIADVDKFGVELQQEIESHIEKLFSERIQFSQNFLNIYLGFYNDLLEKQSRYQQETSEQRLAEKAWIDQQRRSLLEIQAKLDELISSRIPQKRYDRPDNLPSISIDPDD
jgi:hypothetical protein